MAIENSLLNGGQPQGVAASALASDPFEDLEQLRVSQDFGASLGLKKLRLTVPVRKPDRQWFVRVHPDEGWHLQTALLNLKDAREAYLVDRPLWEELAGDVVPTVLLTSINRHNVVFLWPIRLPQDGRQDEWNRSALEAAQVARTRWVRIAANMALGAYDVFAAEADLPEPEWPHGTFKDLLRVAFKDRIIQSLDHPVLQQLRGES